MQSKLTGEAKRLNAKRIRRFVVAGCMSIASLRALSGPLLTVSERDAKHAALEKPAPTISQLARQMKVSGRVDVNVEITEQGVVRTAKIIAGNPLLGESVLIAVKRWKFQAFRQNGSEVPVTTTLTFEFKQ